jgi:transcriptional regulator with XRE-family HTH domain
MPVRTQRSHVAADRPLALRVGRRLRKARLAAGMTQAQLAAGRYTKAYVSALENGLSKPSMAAIGFFAERLHVPIERLIADDLPTWTRLEADLLLASGDWQGAVDAFSSLLEAHQPERIEADLLLGLAEASARLDRGQDAVRAASSAEALYRAQGRAADAAWATYWQAFGLYELEQGPQAAALLERILDAVAAGLVVEPDLPVRALIALANVASRDLEPERALAYLELARGRLSDLDERKRAIFLFSLAVSYHELGDYEAAITTGNQSLARFRATEADREAASLENELALVYLALGSLDVARAHAGHAREYFERHDDQRWLAHVTETDAQIALASGAVDHAISLATEARRLADASGDRKAAVSALLSLGRGQRAAGDLNAAAATLSDATVLARQLGRRAQLQAVLGAWSEVVAAQGDLATAYALSREALDAGRR